MITQENIMIAVGVTVSLGVAYFYFRSAMRNPDEFQDYRPDVTEFMVVAEKPQAPRLAADEDSVCAEHLNGMFEQARTLWDRNFDEAQRFRQSYLDITDR